MTEKEPHYLADDYDDDRDIDVMRYENGTVSWVTFDDPSEDLLDMLVGRFKEIRQRQRRSAAMARNRLRRHQERIKRASDSLRHDSVWYTSLNEKMLISEMTPKHAANSLNLVVNDFGRWAGDDIVFEELGLPFLLEDAPLVKALRKRSKAKETKRHRRLDEVSDAVYRAAAAGGKVNVWETIQEFEKINGKF